MNTFRVVLLPNTVKTALLARDLFGYKRVDVGCESIAPVSVEGVTEEEADAAEALLAEKGVTLVRPKISC